MKKIIGICIFYFSFSLQAQIIPLQDCKGSTDFVSKLNFAGRQIAFSTSERQIRGLVCFVPSDPSKANKYQHESWSKAGYLSALIFDPEGNIYVIPTPTVNTLYNDPKRQNIIFKVDSKTAVMDSFMSLPMSCLPNEFNPFGLLGLSYDCEDDFMYASTVMGSDHKNERGRIYSIAIKRNSPPEIVDSLVAVDAIGIGVARVNKVKKLFWGSARNSEIYSVELDSLNHFVGKPRVEVSLENYGVRGDDKARKIKFTQNNQMVVKGAEFYYTLIAPVEKQESSYVFQYDPNYKRWILVAIE